MKVTKAMLKAETLSFDIAIVGGGSGGLSIAKQMSGGSAKIVVFDFVKPSPKGSVWGLGGTCTNVGCIPKKIFHTAGIMKDQLQLYSGMGMDVELKSLEFGNLTKNVQNYIKSLNFLNRTMLMKGEIKYFNELATFYDKETIISSKNPQTLIHLLQGEEVKPEDYNVIKFKQAVIAIGGRPVMPKIPGIEHAISSDDVFFLKQLPKKALIVGGGYIAHECGCYLKHLGSDVTIITRGRFMRQFDDQVAERLHGKFQESGLKFSGDTTPLEIVKNGDKLSLKAAKKSEKGEENISFDDFDIILFAIAREPVTKDLNLNSAFDGQVNVMKDGRFKGMFKNEKERLAENLYAVGDCLEDVPQLTPVAIRAGRILSGRLEQRLNGIDKEHPPLNYELFPTTVFTSPEYSYSGFSEQQAIEKYGKDKVICYHREGSAYEKALSDTDKTTYFKIVCLKEKDEPILGMHFVGPNAGEVMQGFYVAMTTGLTKKALDETYGIHPICAEDFIDLNKLSTNPDCGKSTCCS